MDRVMSLVELSPYMILTEVCPEGHLHILGGFLSSVPAGSGETDTYTNSETSHTLRVKSRLVWSLN